MHLHGNKLKNWKWIMSSNFLWAPHPLALFSDRPRISLGKPWSLFWHLIHASLIWIKIIINLCKERPVEINAFQWRRSWNWLEWLHAVNYTVSAPLLAKALIHSLFSAYFFIIVICLIWSEEVERNFDNTLEKTYPKLSAVKISWK